MSLLRSISAKLGVSVIAEVFRSEQVQSLQQGIVDVNVLLAEFSPSLRCEGDDKEFHVYDVALVPEGSLLNYKFAYFEMPETVDLFRLTLHNRLATEPWARKSSEKALINPGAGYVSAESRLYPLKNESFRDITARNLLMRAASEQIIVSIIEFPRSSEQLTENEKWISALAHWTWNTGRPLGAN